MNKQNGLIGIFILTIVAVIASGFLAVHYYFTGDIGKDKLSYKLQSLVKRDASYVDEKTIVNARSDYEVFATFKVGTDQYVLAKIIKASIKDDEFIGIATIVLPNGQLSSEKITANSNKIILKNGQNTIGRIVENATTVIKLSGNKYVPIKINTAEIRNGVLEGVFSAKMIDTGFTIAANAQGRIISEGYILTTPSYISDTSRAIGQLVVTEAQLKYDTKDVLAAHDENIQPKQDSVSIDLNNPTKIIPHEKGVIIPLYDSGTYSISGLENEGGITIETLEQLITSVFNTSNIGGITLDETTNLSVASITANSATFNTIDLPDDSVNTSIIKDGEVQEADIADGSVTSAKIKNGTIVGEDIKDGAVGNSQLAHSTFTLTAGNGLANGGTVSLGDSVSIEIDAVTTGATGNTSSNSGLEVSSNGLRLLGGCANGELLKWNAGSAVWECSTDGGGGGGSLTIQENDATVVGSASTLDFLGSDFIISNSPSGEGNVSIDYANSSIARTNQSETVSGIYNFTNGVTVSGGTVTLPSGQIDNNELANSSVTVTAGNGLANGGSVALGGSVTLNVGGGNGIGIASDAVALGALSADWDQTGAFDIVLNNASSELRILESAGGTFYGAFDVGDLSADQTFTFTSGGTVYTTGNNPFDTAAEIQAVAVGGDASGTIGAIVVGDNSHNHDTTTISGLDISDDTNLSASDGITLTGDALTNSDKGSSQNIFKTVAVSGQSNVVTDTNADTLTLVAGSNVTITTDASTDSVTINATDSNTTYSAGNDLDLTGTTFDIESTLDFVSTINLAGTGTINGLDAIDSTTETTLESALDIGGEVTSTGMSSVTINANVIDDSELVDALTYTGALTISSSALTLQNSETLDTSTNSTFTLGRNDAGTVTLTAKDNNSVADLTVLPGGAAALTLGGSSTTSVTVTTDSTGDGEVVLPNNSVGNAELVNSSVTVTAGSGLANGGSVALGASTTLNIGAGNGITANADDVAINLTSSGTTGSTSSNSGLEVGSGGLTLLKGCADNEVLKYTDAGGWACSTDSTGGSLSIKEGGSAVVNPASAVNFLAADFAVSDEGSSQAGIAIDYTNSKIVRSNQAETITGGWTFNTAATTFTTAITANGGLTTAAGTNLSLVSGNHGAGTAGNISVDVGTSSSGNGSILIGTAARAQTITIGNSTGGTITIGASSGSDLALNDAQWSITGAGAGSFASVAVGGDTINDFTGTGLVMSGNSLTTTLGTAIDSSEITDNTITLSDIADSLTLDADLAIAAGAAREITYNKTFTDATSENGFVFNNTASDTSAGTTAQYGMYIDNLASTEGLDASLVIDNSDADDVVGAAIKIIDAGGGFTTIIDNAGTLLSGAELNRLDGKDAALVDVNDAVTTAITGTGTLTAGATGAGFTLNFGASTLSGNVTGANISGVDISDDTNLSASDGIALTGDALTNTDKGSSQNIFKTIAVSGQSNVVTDTNGDTLTLVAGSNVTITTDASTDTITIDAADTNTTYSAGKDLDLTGTTFDIESTLDFVDTINLAGTGTLNGLDAIDGTTETTIETAIDTLANLTSVTIAGDTITDFTGTGLAMSGNSLTATLGTSIANSELDNDTIDFDKISDSATLDADTAIAAGAGREITYNKTYTDATSETGFIYNLTASDTSTGTTAQYGVYIDNVASTEGADALLVLDNSDADDVVGAAIKIIDAGGGFTTIIDNAGTLISGTELNRLDGKDAALVDTNDAVATAITGTGTLTAGATGAGFTLNFGASTLSGNVTGANISGVDISDDTNLSASDGITLTGDALTNSDKGSSQNIFKTISVSGQTDVVTDTNGDTLTLAAGTNVSITTNAGTDTITINATDTNTTYSAGKDLDLTGTTFDIESTLDFVDTINLAGTGTLNGLDAIDGTSETTLEAAIDIAGEVTGTGLGSVTIADDVIDDAELVNSLTYTGAFSVGNLTISDTNVPLTGASLTFDFNNAADRTLTIANSGAGTANLSVDGTIGGSNFSGSSSGTNTGDQNVFTTLAVSGQTNVVSDAASDTLTLVAGTNVTITTNAGTDTITLNATDTNTTYSAGNDLDLTGTTFDLESTLDFVDTINLAGTGTLNGLDAIDGTTETTIETAIDTLANLASVTIAGDTITDFTGTGLAMSGNSLTTTLGTSIANSELDNDTIDFDKISDTATLDADTSIAAGAGKEITYNKTFTDATSENGIVVNFTAADTTSGTSAQYGMYLDNLASTEGLDASLVIDNSDADDVVGAAIKIIDAGGGFTNIIDNAGTLISGAELNRLDGVNAALVDTNDAVATAITGTGTLTAGATGAGFTLNFGASTLSGNVTGANISGVDISDDTNLTASDGITLTGDALTNSDKGSSQNIFKTIAVSGQSNVVTDTNGDTLTLVAGTNVSITTDASTDSITINATDANTTYSAGKDLDLNATTFDIESTLDFVDTINLAGTGTLNGLDAIDSTTETTIEDSIDTLANLASVTIGGDTITDFTGTGLAMSGNSLTASLGTAIDTTEITTDTIDWTDISDGMTLDDPTTSTHTSNTQTADSWTFSLVNSGGVAGTDQAFVIRNGVSTNSTNDVTTEALLLVDQADTTTSGTTVVTDAIKVDSSGSSGITNGMTITNSGGNVTTGLNIADTAGGTLTTGIALSGTFTTGIDAGSAIIINVGNSGTDFDSSGGLTLASTLTLSNNTITCTACIDVTDIGANAVDDSELADTISYTGALTIATSALAVNSDSITSDGATLTINAAGAVDIQDNVTGDTLTLDANAGTAITISGTSFTTDIVMQNGETIDNNVNGSIVLTANTDTTVILSAADTSNANTPFTINSAGTGALTLDSAAAGNVNLGTNNNAKTIAIGTGTAGNAINIGTDNTTKDTITIGSALDDVAIAGDDWSITNAGVLTVQSCSGCGGGGSTLQQAYVAGASIDITSGEGALDIDAQSANVDFEIGEGTDTGDFRIWDGSANWLFIDESADTLALGAAAGAGITIGGTGITTTNSGALTVSEALAASSTLAVTGKSGFGATFSASDYLMELTANTTGDYSRVIDIAQSNDADEDSSSLYITATPTLGSIAANRNVRGTYLSLTPSLTIPNNKAVNIFGNDINLSLSSLIHSTSTANTIRSNTYGNSINITGTPVFDDNNGGDTTTARVWGTNSSVILTPTLTNISDTTFETFGGYFKSDITSAGAANLTNTSYGVYGTAIGNLTTTGQTTHYAGYFITSGSADTNYGLYTSAGGATTSNYALYSASGDNYFAGNVGIGDSSPGAPLEVGDGTDSLQVSSVGDITFVDANGAASITGPAGGALTISAANSQNLAFTTTTAGDVTITTAAGSGLANVLTGNLKVGNGTPGVTLNGEDAYIEGTFEVDGTSQFDAAVSVTSGGLTVSGGSFSLSGSGRSTKKATLIPEFPGAVLTGDGSNNTGTMTSDFCSNGNANSGNGLPDTNTGDCPTSGDVHNYYKWASTSGTSDYDVWVPWQVPSDFSEFASSTAVKFNSNKTAAGDAVTVTLYNDSKTTKCGSATAVGSSAAWAQTNYADPTGCDAASGGQIDAGDVVFFRVQLSSTGSSSYARIGEIEVSYLAKF